MTRLLIDADILAFRAGFATDKTKYVVTCPSKMELVGPSHYFDDAKAAKEHAFSNDGIVWSRKETEPEDKALMLVDVMINDIRSHYAAENPTISCYLSGVGNYRHGIATRANYKGNRSGAVPPAHLKAIRAHLVSKWNAVLSVGEEADDCIYTEATRSNGSAIVVSQDKDFSQIPGRIYDFVKKEEKLVTQKQAILSLYAQALSGDSADNIPGATGYGPVKANKALEKCKSPWDCWQVVLGIYLKEFGIVVGQAYALEAMRLVKLGQKEKLWEPPCAPKQ